MKMKMTFGLMTLMFSSVSCTMMPHRDYLSEMEHEESSFYRPNEDFPVIGGDTGKISESRSERRRRTPASAYDRRDQLTRDYLHDELRALESRQPEGSIELYEKYKNQLGSNSEKIYFLKLPVYERKDYLLSKGLIKTEARSYLETDEQFEQRQGQVMLGMNKDDVMGTLGKPARVEVAGNPSFENERWLYQRNGASKYIYFESGRVEGWD